MSLREALKAGGTRAWRRHRAGPAPGRAAAAGTNLLKARIHDKLLERFDIAAIESTSSDQLRRRLTATVSILAHTRKTRKTSLAKARHRAMWPRL